MSVSIKSFAFFFFKVFWGAAMILKSYLRLWPRKNYSEILHLDVSDTIE